MLKYWILGRLALEILLCFSFKSGDIPGDSNMI